MQTQTAIPVVHVTNYQLHINTDVLAQAITDRLQPCEALAGKALYVSVAYMQVQKVKSTFKTTLVLSIKGRSYRYYIMHDNEYFYLTQVALDQNSFTGAAAKDTHIRIYQHAFIQVVEKNIAQITKALVTAYMPSQIP